MRSRWLAVSSVLLCAALAARAETRPHYGGTLRVETQGSIGALPTPDAAGGSNALAGQIANLIYDPGRGEGKPGPFRVAQFVPGKKLTLTANDEYPGGRPHLDAIEIQMARPVREQMLDLQLERADVVDLPPEMIRRATQQGVRLAQSQPVELIAIVFANDDPKLREALALSVDRAAIFNVLLGRQGEPTAALLPNWMTGYGFVFDAGQDIQRARQLRMESRRTQPLTLTYDPQDGLARAIAERVALDARGAGLAITPTTSIASPDARLVRVLLPTHDPQAALAAVAAALGASAPKNDDVPEEWYAAERRLRDDLHVVPILHVPVAYGLGARVKGWAASKSGAWALDDVWLEQRP